MSESYVTKLKRDQLDRRMAQLGILGNDLRERFILGSGRGGQKVNKTSSCVHLRHPPSGIVIKCQKTRSRALNRYYARKELCERIQGRIRDEMNERQQKDQKIRRQKRRRSRRQKEKMLEAKRRQGTKKTARRAVDLDVEG